MMSLSLAIAIALTLLSFLVGASWDVFPTEAAAREQMPGEDA